MLLANDIKLILSSRLPSLKERYPISGMAIFGSYARGEATDNSDLDTIVDFNEDFGWEFFDLAKEIEELLHQKIDLVSGKAIKPHYWPHMKQDMIYV